MALLSNINECRKTGRKLFSLLIDPDKYQDAALMNAIDAANDSDVDFFLIGGSLTAGAIDDTITFIKKHSSLPVILYPGNLLQLSTRADGILLLSLLSGRNADLLIGNHVIAAPLLKKSRMEIIPTGYILVGSGTPTSVEYMSHTMPIPAHKPDIIAATAMAGEMLGFKLIYLEAGSGASQAIQSTAISHVRKNIDIPLIVGGGINTPEQVMNAFSAGADIVVVGTAIEKNITLLKDISAVTKRFFPSN